MTRTHPFRQRWALCMVGALIAAPLPVAAQTAPASPLIGRWDLQVTSPERTYPSWLEVRLSGRETLVGRFVGASGSMRPISRVEFADGEMRFAIPPQWEQGTGDLEVLGRLEDDRLVGTLVTPAGAEHTLVGTRAPYLRRAAAPEWGEPIALFNGQDLSGWDALGESRWSVVDGVLTNAGGGANLVSTQQFDDFRLHVEFRYPEGSNSGVYLRGRYEVQIEDSPERPEPLDIDHGSIYGFLAPSEKAAAAPGEWQTYDITLVGRRVTVVLNGRTIIADRVIPGITGGALDSNEGEPGPLLLQGDHGPVEFRQIVITPARYPSAQ